MKNSHRKETRDVDKLFRLSRNCESSLFSIGTKKEPSSPTPNCGTIKQIVLQKKRKQLLSPLPSDYLTRQHSQNQQRVYPPTPVKTIPFLTAAATPKPLVSADIHPGVFKMMINTAANLTISEINQAEKVRKIRLKNVLQGR